VSAAEGQVALDQVNLFLALGGGWEEDRQDAGETVGEKAGAKTERHAE